VDAVVGELDLLARDRVLDGDEHLAGLAHRHDPGPGIDCQASELRPHHLGLAEMDAGADLEPQLPDALARVVRAPDRVRRLVEHREEAVPGGVQLATVVPPQRLPYHPVMRGDELAPTPVADLGRDLRRGHDVREQGP
jgi:hypothetical protein